jgi:hypothetical protein
MKVSFMVAPIPIDSSAGHKIAKRRPIRRKQKSLSGRLVYGAEFLHVDCVIRDFNEKGARVWIAETDSVPDSVTLLEPSNLMAYDAKAMWRCGNLIGLSFNRAFSVDSEDAIRLSALRRLTFEMREQSTADDALQTVTGP